MPRQACVASRLEDATIALVLSTDLRLGLFDWASSKSSRVAIKLHILPDLRDTMPAFIHISNTTRTCWTCSASRLAPLRDESRLCGLRAIVCAASARRIWFMDPDSIKTPVFLNLQHHPSRPGDRRAVQKPLAGRVVLQADQAASAHSVRRLAAHH
jgi:hypothetical protein